MTTNQKKNVAVIGATLVSLVIVPAFVFAQTTGLAVDLSTCTSTSGAAQGLTGILCTVYKLIRIVIPVLILGAVAYFIWGIVEFITAKEAEEKSKARGAMIHGIIGFVVILGLWGIVGLLLNTFTLNNTSSNLHLPAF